MPLNSTSVKFNIKFFFDIFDFYDISNIMDVSVLIRKFYEIR